MSASRPKVTLETHPTKVKFTNIITAEDMQDALKALPKTARTASFSSHNESTARMVDDAIFYDNSNVLYDDSNSEESDNKSEATLPQEITPKAIHYFFKHNHNPPPKYIPHIQHVIFCGITQAHAAVLGKSLASDQKVFSLCLRENEITADGIVALNMALQTNTTLRTLDISHGEELDGKAITALSYTNLTALHTANNSLNGAHAAALLNTHPQLLVLDISQNDLCADEDTDDDHEDNAVAAVAALPANLVGNADSPRGVQSGSSEQTDIDEPDNVVVIDSPRSIQSNSTRLTGEHNNQAEIDELAELPSTSLVALITAINTHTALREIHLDDCNLDTENQEPAMPAYANLKRQLFTALFQHATLTIIDIANNLLDHATLRLIAFDVIKRNRITHLNMNGCIQDLQMAKDHEEYPQNYMYMIDSLRILFSSRVTHLFLAQNNLGNDELALLRPQLRTNTTLVELCLANNGITHDGVQHLLPFLERTRTLQVLDLRNNPIKYAGLVAILEALQRNKNCAVHTLILSGCSINAPRKFAENNFLEKIPRSLLHLNLCLNGISTGNPVLMQRVQQKLRSNQALLRFTQRVSPLIAFVRTHGVKHPLHASVLPVIPEIMEHLGSGTIEIDIREHQKRSAATAAGPAMKPAAG